ncbi:unnamed protein product, partial [Urochloa humidicola]
GQWLRFLGEANVHTLVTFVAEPKSGSQELVLIKSRSLEFVIFRGEGENVLTHGREIVLCGMYDDLGNEWVHSGDFG